jgi:hypothetical protein
VAISRFWRSLSGSPAPPSSDISGARRSEGGVRVKGGNETERSGGGNGDGNTLRASNTDGRADGTWDGGSSRAGVLLPARTCLDGSLPGSCQANDVDPRQDYPQPLPLNFSPYITFSLYFSPYFFISRSGFL